MKRRPTLAGKVVLAGLLALTASVPASQAFAGKGGEDGPRPDPGLAKAITYDSAGLTSRPISSRLEASLTEEEAVERARSLGFGDDLLGGDPRVALRSVTLANGAISDAGVAVPVEDRPAWVIVFPRSAPEIYGDMLMPQAERDRIRAGLRCSFIVAVDAVTGEALSTSQECDA